MFDETGFSGPIGISGSDSKPPSCGFFACLMFVFILLGAFCLLKDNIQREKEARQRIDSSTPVPSDE